MKKLRENKYMKLVLDFVLLNVFILILMLISAVLFKILANTLQNDYIISILKISLDFIAIIIAIKLFNKCIKQQCKDEGSINKDIIYYIIYAIVTAVLIVSLMALFKSIKFDGFIWGRLYVEDIISIIIVGIFECLLEVAYEEVLYRKVVNNLFSDTLDTRVTVILSTIYYLLMHGLDTGLTPIVLVNLALLNVILTITYNKKRNLIYCVVPRAVLEFMMAYGFSINRMGRDEIGIAFFSRVNNSIINGGVYGGYGSIIVTFILLGTIYFILGNRKVKSKNNS